MEKKELKEKFKLLPESFAVITSSEYDQLGKDLKEVPRQETQTPVSMIDRNEKSNISITEVIERENLKDGDLHIGIAFTDQAVSRTRLKGKKITVGSTKIIKKYQSKFFVRTQEQ